MAAENESRPGSHPKGPVDFTHIFREELKLLAHRRQFQGYTPPKVPSAATPSADLNLVGLGISGGGIRSATLNLGVVQRLAEYGVFNRVDYLSTVSGGGMLGSCLSNIYHQAPASDKPIGFPFTHRQGKPENKAFHHLRDYSNYLTPKGLVDILRIPLLLLIGQIANFVILIPYIILAVLITVFLGSGMMAELTTQPDKVELFYWTKRLGGLILGILIFYPLLQQLFSSNWNLRNNATHWLGFSLMGLAVLAFSEAQPLVIQAYARRMYNLLDDIAGPMDLLAYVGAAVAALSSLFSGKVWGTLSKAATKAKVYLIGMLPPLFLWLVYLEASRLAFFYRPRDEWGFFSAIPLFDRHPYLPMLLAMGFGAWLFGLFCIDLNRISMHKFYRDRLSRAYMFNPFTPGDAPPAHTDTTLLSAITPGQGPYHLVNAALNIGQHSSVNLRGRDSVNFTFAKGYCGSDITGYCPTRLLEKADRQLNLATAMAISGAAVSPHAGTTTVKPLVLMMALLNLRLGYWLPNPAKVARAGLLKKLSYRLTRPNPSYLLRDMTDNFNEKTDFLNLSDGGHLENLAGYELLKRRCKFIIILDGEEDHNMTFNGLAQLIRLAQIDLSIHIEIEVDPLRKKPETGFSTHHCAFGTIHYSDTEKGELLYIKSSMTGDENVYIEEYQSRYPSFPHQNTADQFFDEAQFEAYRALGSHMAKSLFEGEDGQPDSKTTARQWLENLASLDKG